jgi:hypothetical protein
MAHLSFGDPLYLKKRAACRSQPLLALVRKPEIGRHL